MKAITAQELMNKKFKRLDLSPKYVIWDDGANDYWGSKSTENAD